MPKVESTEPPSPQHEPVSLTDRLAVDRTVLANERTLLAYLRTALGFLALGVTSLHFLEQPIYRIIGWLFLAFGPLVVLAGVTRFVQVHRKLRAPPPQRGT